MYGKLVIEEFISGKEFTALVYNDKVLVAERIFSDKNKIDFHTENGEFTTIAQVDDEMLIKRL